jgi:hypothetical protein
MADIAASDVTYTEDTAARNITGTRRLRSFVFTLAFGDGALTYPSGGVPLTAAKLGCPTSVQDLTILDQSAAGILWTWDRSNNKLRGYIQGVTVGAAGAVTTDDFPLDTTADPLATTVSVQLTNSTGAGTKYLGKLKELSTAATPAAQSLKVRVVGY